MTDDVLLAQANKVESTMPDLRRRFFSMDIDDPAMELPMAQMRVCLMLQCGPRAMSVIGRELGISLSAVTQIADRLERAGLVERVAEPDDRRVKCLQLTSDGQDTMKRRRERRVQRVAEALSRLSATERESVMSALSLLMDATQPLM